jgi:opacity protein-like surface antigen
MRLRSIILTLAGCLLTWAAHPGTAEAQPIQGFYVNAGAGLRWAFPTRSTSLEPGVGGTFELRQKLGYDTDLSVGYALGNGWRFELEGTHDRGAIKGVYSTAFPSSTSAGSVQNTGVMANALFDLDVRSRYVFPYLGFGAGYQATRLDGFVQTRTDKPGGFSASGGTGGFAMQAIAGLSFPIPNMPGLSLTVDYRVMDILGGGSYQGVSTIGLPAGSVPEAGAIKFHNQFDQTVMFGVRYAFNPPSPAAVAPPVTTPAAELESYEVAFGPDKTTLTDRARGIVRAAAVAYTRQGITRIAVTENGGMPGVTSRDHQTLSGRRANTVVATLVAAGVPRDAIAVRASSDDRGALMTGDQRIEIVTE